MSEPNTAAAPIEDPAVDGRGPGAEEEEEDLGIPSLNEPFIQKYMDGRDALIAQEKRQRSDHAFRENMTPMAAEAAATVSAIRFQEQQTIWTHDFEDEVAKKEGVEIFPGMMFNLAKDRMEKSKLWQIVRKMPKGALLMASA
jgi:adenosine deaminase CECR1